MNSQDTTSHGGVGQVVPKLVNARTSTILIVIDSVFKMPKTTTYTIFKCFQNLLDLFY